MKEWMENAIFVFYSTAVLRGDEKAEITSLRI